jgi:hypothetical protein
MFHILNGDALKEQFPKQLAGDLIVARECLVDGDVQADSLDELFQVRSAFISDFYGDYTKAAYYADSVAEFEKIQRIPKHSEVNLWFEDDLFCQVNFWFVAYLLDRFVSDSSVFLIRPQEHSSYGFGGLNESALLEAFEKRTRISEIARIATLWTSYQTGDTEGLVDTARSLSNQYPFILNAVEAHLARIPTENNPGRPVQSLLEIMDELGTTDFGLIFKEFNKREAVYGFGDLQVKRLLDGLLNKD